MFNFRRSLHPPASKRITQLSKRAADLDAGQVIRWKSWHRWTAACLLAYLYLAVAVAVVLQRQQEARLDPDTG